ncbi:unnamed protein product [Linum tenue]|uniref:Uncharacterized protein n=1 Tax=Linum tenue TaxID=586396 RepID=A0AAV0MIS0_9ROSI|nr:unnamed protein product [Linum tenue]
MLPRLPLRLHRHLAPLQPDLPSLPLPAPRLRFRHPQGTLRELPPGDRLRQSAAGGRRPARGILLHGVLRLRCGGGGGIGGGNGGPERGAQEKRVGEQGG